MNLEAQPQTPTEIKTYDFRRPLPGFKYLAYPEMPAVENEFEEFKHYVLNYHRIAKFSGLNVHVANNFYELLRNFVLKHKKTEAPLKVLSDAPYIPELYTLKEEGLVSLIPLERDPEEQDFSGPIKPEVVILSNPHRADGFYLPQTILDDLYLRIRQHYSDLPIFIDEAQIIFCLNNVVPGNLRQYLKNDKHLMLSSSLFPSLSPQGPELCWQIDRSTLSVMNECTKDSETLRKARGILLAFSELGGKSIAEYQRRLLVVKLGLRTMADELGPSKLRKLIEVHHWPMAGFYLLVDLRGWMKATSLSEAELLHKIKTEAGITLRPGTLMGAPGHAQLCYAAAPRQLANAMRQLQNLLPEKG